jgi:hypothetical protein
VLTPTAAPARNGGEAGAGVLSAVFGVVLFCGFLLLTAQVLLTLHRTSLVASATAESAHVAARAPGPGAPGCSSANEVVAVTRAHALLGPHVSATATCAGPSLRVEVAAPRPRLIAGFGSPTIVRAVTVRVESRQVVP